MVRQNKKTVETVAQSSSSSSKHTYDISFPEIFFRNKVSINLVCLCKNKEHFTHSSIARVFTDMYVLYRIQGKQTLLHTYIILFVYFTEGILLNFKCYMRVSLPQTDKNVNLLVFKMRFLYFFRKKKCFIYGALLKLK